MDLATIWFKPITCTTLGFKVKTLWDGHKIWKNLPLIFIPNKQDDSMTITDLNQARKKKVEKPLYVLCAIVN